MRQPVCTMNTLSTRCPFHYAKESMTGTSRCRVWCTYHTEVWPLKWNLNATSFWCQQDCQHTQWSHLYNISLTCALIMFNANSATRMPPTKASTNTVSKDCLIELVHFTMWIWSASSYIINTSSTNASSDILKSHSTHRFQCATTTNITNLSHVRIRAITMHNTQRWLYA